MLTELQYRILRRWWPQESPHMRGAAYAGRSKLHLVLGEEAVARLRGKRVIEFGCGAGTEAVELAKLGATVLGLDIQERWLAAARALAEREGVTDRCRFATGTTERVDAVVSIDSFEHFEDPAAVLDAMYELLRPGGTVLASFGPTWYHPFGGHLFSVFPWAHLLFSERALIRWRSHFRTDGATRFAEVAGGLNQMTIGRFERLVRASRFHIASLEPVPIRRLRYLHCRATREVTSSLVRCVLRKREHTSTRHRVHHANLTPTSARTG